MVSFEFKSGMVWLKLGWIFVFRKQPNLTKQDMTFHSKTLGYQTKL